MEGHIYIYGVIDSYQVNNSDEYGIVSLKNIKSQVENQSEADTLVVHIHSEGGLVTEGFAIHDYLRSTGKKIITQIEGLCASIATVIALAGDERKMSNNSDFMIHNPWGFTGGESSDLRKYADELERLEDKIQDFYVSKTNLTKDQVTQYMKDETWLSAEKALEYGFVTEVMSVMRAVARFKENSNTNTMANLSNEDKNWLKELVGSIKNAFKPSVSNIVMQDANGVSIDFYELEEGQDIVVGAKATIENESANGEHVMPSGETYVFSGGELTEIKEAEEEEENEMAQENEELKAQVEELTQAKAELENKLEEKDKVYAKLEEETNKKLAQISSKFDLDNTSDPKPEPKPKKRTLLKQE